MWNGIHRKLNISVPLLEYNILRYKVSFKRTLCIHHSGTSRCLRLEILRLRPNTSYLNQRFARANLPETAASISFSILLGLYWLLAGELLLIYVSLDVRILVFADKYETDAEVIYKVIKALSGALYIEDLILPYIYLIDMHFLLF